MIYKFQAKIVGGIIQFEKEKKFVDYLNSLNGKQVEVIVQKKSSARSIQQNAYFHGVICRYWGEYAGNDIATMKGVLKGKFLTATADIKGKEVSYVRATSSLTVAEMRTFIDDCKKYAIEYGIVMPDMDEVEP